MEFRVLAVDDAAAVARVHRVSFDERLPWLVGLHTSEEDWIFYRDRVFRDCRVFGVVDRNMLVGVMALRDGWIDQLYVLPQAQGRGAGAALLAVAQESQDDLSLWTFQRNRGARGFYEHHGFVAVEETDGSTNEEREPDVRYHWRKQLPR